MIEKLENKAEQIPQVPEKMRNFTYSKKGITIMFDHVSERRDKQDNPDIGISIFRDQAWKNAEKISKKTEVDGITYEYLQPLSPKDDLTANVSFKAWEKFVENPEQINLQPEENYKDMNEILKKIRELDKETG